MKYNVLLGLQVFFISALVNVASCNEMNSTNDIEARIQTITEELSLTPDQVVGVRDILVKSKNDMGNDAKVNARYRQASMLAQKQIRSGANAQILNLLSTEQKKKFQQIVSGDVNDNQLILLKETLSLTGEQMQEFENIITVNRPKIAKIRNEATTPKQYHRAMGKFMRRQAKEMEKILTKEQKIAFRAFRKKKEVQMEKAKP